MMEAFSCSPSSLVLRCGFSSPTVVGSAERISSGNQSFKSSPVVVHRNTYSDSALTSKHGVQQSKIFAHTTAESQHKDSNDSQSPMLQIERMGFSSFVSTTKIAGLATALLASAVGGGLAAVEAGAVPEDENSNFKFLVVCVAEAIALTGAAVGGLLARQRKVELEKINAQLRQINISLRRQSRVESYAPNLTYAPVGSGRMQDSQVRSDPVRDELTETLKAGKRLLREKNPVNAYREFQKALSLAHQLRDTGKEKKAARGLGASCQRQGKYKEAIKHHMLVLQVSTLAGESSGDTEAYGAIADCYTELGDLETAGKFYDRYIERLETDDFLSSVDN